MTARLSKHFYERLGEQVANELVDWFNAVDATYKAELREMNELNFARFDAKVSQRFAEIEQRFAQFEARIEQRFAQFEVRVEARLDAKFGEHTRFMYLAWATMLAAVIGLYVR